MTPFLRGLVRAVSETFVLPGPVLEVGSYRVEGQDELADLRPFFAGRRYLGLDARPGRGVDLVGDVERLPLADASIGTVLVLDTFEHVPRFWRGFEEVQRVLRPDGALLVASPFYFHLHGFPSDYWRFTPQAFEVLLEPYPSRIIGWQGPARRPGHVWTLAFREGRPPIRPEEHAAYEERMRQYARQPLPWRRRLRYLLGRWLFGSRPFAPFLERERWRSRCVNHQPAARLRNSAPSFLCAADW
jgi:SAM-dependent methyltransferase